jgi:hypothetical protein
MGGHLQIYPIHGWTFCVLYAKLTKSGHDVLLGCLGKIVIYSCSMHHYDVLKCRTPKV